MNTEKLLVVARDAADNSYSPYSKFRVGAALLGANGKIYCGTNVENASYGLTNCAERVAIGQAITDGCKEIVAVAIYTPTLEATAPCGACRQVLNEFGPQMRVICGCDSDQSIDTTLDELLPGAFGPKNLGIGE